MAKVNYVPANFTCKCKETSIGLNYDDRHAEIPKYWVPYRSWRSERNLQIISLICIKSN